MICYSDDIQTIVACFINSVAWSDFSVRKYCMDMEVNNIACLPYPIEKYIEKPREELTCDLTDEDKRILVSMFMENLEELETQLALCPAEQKRILLFLILFPAKSL